MSITLYPDTDLGSSRRDVSGVKGVDLEVDRGTTIPVFRYDTHSLRGLQTKDRGETDPEFTGKTLHPGPTKPQGLSVLGRVL